jgi:hypothetical protein
MVHNYYNSKQAYGSLSSSFIQHPIACPPESIRLTLHKFFYVYIKTHLYPNITSSKSSNHESSMRVCMWWFREIISAWDGNFSPPTPHTHTKLCMFLFSLNSISTQRWWIECLKIYKQQSAKNYLFLLALVSIFPTVKWKDFFPCSGAGCEIWCKQK